MLVDPLTILLTLAFAVAKKSGADTLSSTLGNVAGNLLTDDIHKIRQSFLTLTRPDQNQDLERALARSALHAGLFCVMEALGEPMKPPAGKLERWQECVTARIPDVLKELTRPSKGWRWSRLCGNSDRTTRR